ncbi:hypothetical protein LshimejAT787_1202240 [Lyophyllum shimeji]|uniref:Uncharacterized protein n=1 Tax=Lyophyllum shimeji TaxID=47721 RepID=A0A9P3USR1_LYOSH|nr:hypothetical protein LshimejAT787_1202240 [Lyophyllum shimeji]
MLSNISTLILDQLSGGQWNSLTPAVKIALLHILRSPQTQGVVLGNVVLPENYPRSASDMVELGVASGHPIGPAAEPDLLQTSTPGLDDVHNLHFPCVDSSSGARRLRRALAHPKSSISLAGLRIFIGSHAGDVNLTVILNFQKIFDLARESLKDVRISLPLGNHVELARLPRLIMQFMLAAVTRTSLVNFFTRKMPRNASKTDSVVEIQSPGKFTVLMDLGRSNHNVIIHRSPELVNAELIGYVMKNSCSKRGRHPRLPMSWVTSVAGTSAFPPEVLETIIGKFTDDPSTLRACSIVCSAFRVPSQRSLHSSVSIRLDNWRRDHNIAQAHFFATNTRIAEYAKTLRILIVHGGTTCVDWHTLYHLLPSIQGLSLDSHDQEKWSGLTRELKLSILCIMRSRKMRELALNGTVAFPENLLHGIPGLVHLKISSHHALGPVDSEISCEALPNTSNILTLHIGSSLVAEALVRAHHSNSTISLTTLNALAYTHFNDMGNDASSLQSILDLSALSLKNVSINLKTEMWLEPPAPLSLQRLANLRQLSLSINSKSVLDVAWGYRWICSTLETIPEHNHLAEVKLCISYRLSQFAEDVTWACLDGLLARPRHATDLRRYERCVSLLSETTAARLQGTSEHR